MGQGTEFQDCEAIKIIVWLDSGDTISQVCRTPQEAAQFLYRGFNVDFVVTHERGVDGDIPYMNCRHYKDDYGSALDYSIKTWSATYNCTEVTRQNCRGEVILESDIVDDDDTPEDTAEMSSRDFDALNDALLDVESEHLLKKEG